MAVLFRADEVNINGGDYERVLYHDPIIGLAFSADSDDEWLPSESERVPFIELANLFSSECIDGYHRLAIDVDCADMGIDIQSVIDYLDFVWPRYAIGLRYWESTTPGNYHIIADYAMNWGIYEHILGELRDRRYIQEGYYLASLERKRTQLRLPHIKKKVSNA